MLYDRYYYSILPKKEKNVYKSIYDCINNLENGVSLKQSQCFGVDIEKIVQYILLDNPHIFYLDRRGFHGADNFFEKRIFFNYLYAKDEVEELKKKINKVAGKMIKKVTGTTDYEKEKSVHDLIIKNVLYDEEAVFNRQKFASRSNTILGVLFYKTAVCEGVALTVKYLLNILDIKCIVAIGRSSRAEKGDENHAWNIVKIDGESYHLDVTWDLSDKKDFSSYDYFNLTDSDILKDHSFAEKYPACRSQKNNYYFFNNLVAATKADVKRIVDYAIAQNKEQISIKFVGNSNLINLKNYVFSTLGGGKFDCFENSRQQTLHIIRK